MAASDYSTVVQQLYVSYFGRPADPIGLANLSSALDAASAPTNLAGLEAAYSTNSAVNNLINSFGSSAESTALYAGDTLSFVSAIYANLFSRAPDFSGLLFWSNAIDSGAVSKGQAALDIAAAGLMGGENDALVFTNKVTVASTFTSLIDTGFELVGYSGAQAAAQARSLLGSVTDTVPATSEIQNTLTQIVILPGLNAPKPAAITSVVSDYATNHQVTLDCNPSTAHDMQGAVPGYYADVLSYAISNSGEVTFSGTFANTLTAEQKAGDILAILKNMPGTACTFTQYNNQSHSEDTYLVCTGTGTSNAAVIDIVGVTKHGVSSLDIQVPEYWPSPG